MKLPPPSSLTAHQQIRWMMGRLDQVGYVININRVTLKRYELQVNFEVIRAW